MSGNEDKPVLVTGATGRQGGAVLKHLLARGRPVRVLTRRPDSPAALALAARGVEIAAGDMDDRASLERAMRGVGGVYSVRDFWSSGAEREVRQGFNVADAAAATGVAHLVYSSVGGAERNSGIDHWETKWQIEQHIRGLGLPATMLRPAAFMENYYIPAVEKALMKGRLVDPIRSGQARRIRPSRPTTSANSPGRPRQHGFPPQRGLHQIWVDNYVKPLQASG